MILMASKNNKIKMNEFAYGNKNKKASVIFPYSMDVSGCKIISSNPTTKRSVFSKPKVDSSKAPDLINKEFIKNLKMRSNTKTRSIIRPESKSIIDLSQFAKKRIVMDKIEENEVVNNVYDKVKINLENAILAKIKTRKTITISTININKSVRDIDIDKITDNIPSEIKQEIKDSIKRKILHKQTERLHKTPDSTPTIKKFPSKLTSSTFSSYNSNAINSITKEDIENLNKVRSISRFVYSIDNSYDMTSNLCILIDITKMKKLIKDIHDIIIRNANQANKNIEELIKIIEDKLRIINEIEIIKQYMINLDKMGLKPETFQQMLQVTDEEIERPLSKIFCINDSVPNSDVKSQRNSINTKMNKDCVWIRRSTINNIGFISSVNKEISTISESSIQPSIRIDINNTRRHSARLLRLKPFDETKSEKYIKSFFAKITIPIRKCKSCKEKFYSVNIASHDKRRTASCNLDYVVNNSYFKIRKRIKCNSTINCKGNSEDNTTIGKKVSIEDFEIIKGLSSGAYGKVCLVKKISSGDYFAMKIIDKEITAEKSQESFIRSEVTIMRNLDSDYIVKLYYSFQNERFLFFVMEYMNGGDLGNVMQLFGIIDEKVFLL